MRPFSYGGGAVLPMPEAYADPALYPDGSEDVAHIQVRSSSSGGSIRTVESVLTSDAASPTGRVRASSGAYLIAPEVDIFGEPFVLEFEDDEVYLRHPRWSLIGAGSSLLEAEMDLLAEARDLSEVLLKVPHANLDPEAMSLRDFLFRVM
jgi:hypothetical protein